MELSALKDNLEARMLLLRRRLKESGGPMRLPATGRGRFRVECDRTVTLEKVATVRKERSASGDRVKLWIDDLRAAPAGWTHAHDYFEAIALLERTRGTGELEQVSFDHDLACFHDGREFTGYDVALWMAEHQVWPATRPSVHSGNSVGRMNIVAIIDRYGPYRGE